jgi:hypothetical protein
MTPIDFDEIDSADDGTATFFRNGKLFSGIAYERNRETGVIVGLMGFHRGWLSGCSRTWSLSGVLLREEFHKYGVFHGPVRTWNADGTLKSNKYFFHTKQPPPEGTTESVIDIDLEELQFVEHPWGWGKEPAPPPSFDEFHGLKRSEGDKDWYVVEQANGREVVRVESLELKERSLFVAYKRRSLRFSDAFASRLIQAKILGDVCMDAYRGRVDQVSFQSIPTKLVEVVSYSSS